MRSLLTVSVSLLLLTLATGCAPTTPEEIAAPPSSAIETPSSTPTPTVEPIALTCDTLLSSETLAAMLVSPVEVIEPEHEYYEKIAGNDPWATFLANDGVVCAQGVDAGPVTALYAWSTLSADDSATQKAALVAAGGKESAHANGDLIVVPGDQPEYPEFDFKYVIGDGHWVVSVFTPGTDLVDEIAATADTN